MSNVLVLGADGFIGSHMAERLAADGHSVRAFDRLKDAKPRNLQPHPNITPYPGDFLNRQDLDDALEGMEYVFHFVSTTTPATSAKDPFIDIDTNLRMTVELLELAVRHNIKRVIFPSTGGAIYGQDTTRPLKETDLAEPVSPYAIGKLAIEGYLRYFRHTHNLDYMALRISNPYGERQNVVGAQGVIPIFLNRIRLGLPLTVFGDGSMVRDYMYIGDLVDMMAQMFGKPVKHRLYNLGSGAGLTVTELIDCMREVTGKKMEVEHQPDRPTDVKHVVLDTTRRREEFGAPKLLALKEGIERTWKYVLEREGGQ